MSKDDRLIHEGQVLMTVKVRRVVKTAEYENYEVVLDEVHLARETDIKNTRERLIEAMTETIHGKVKAFEAKLIEEKEAERAAELAALITRRLKAGRCPECGCNFPMNEMIGGVVGPRPTTSPCGSCGWVPDEESLKLLPKAEPIDAPVKTDAENEAEVEAEPPVDPSPPKEGGQ